MRAMVLEKIGRPLVLRDIPRPSPRPFEVLIKIQACGVCRTDLHIIERELPPPQLPLILGHQHVIKNGSLEGSAVLKISTASYL